MERIQNRILAAAIFAATMLVSFQALAIGTVAGYVIQNQATANCENAAGQALSFASNTTLITVNTIRGVAVVGGDIESPQQGQTLGALFTLYNTGNTIERIDYTVVGLRAGADPDITLTGNVYHDVACNGVIDVGDAALAGQTDANVNPTDAAYSINRYCILVQYAVAVAATNGDNASLDLSVASANNAAITDTTAASGGNDPAVITVGGPQILVTKAYVNATNAGLTGNGTTTGTVNPGDVVTYTIVVRNNGSTSSFNTVLTDTIDVECSYVAASAAVNDAACTGGCVSQVSQVGGVVTAQVGKADTGGISDGGELEANSQVTITFQCTVNNN